MPVMGHAKHGSAKMTPHTDITLITISLSGISPLMDMANLAFKEWMLWEREQEEKLRDTQR